MTTKFGLHDYIRLVVRQNVVRLKISMTTRKTQQPCGFEPLVVM
jgi:hypothetical protein